MASETSLHLSGVKALGRWSHSTTTQLSKHEKVASVGPVTKSLRHLVQVVSLMKMLILPRNLQQMLSTI